MFNYHKLALISHATNVISQSKSSTIHELWNSICSSWIWKRQRNQRSNCQHPLDHQKRKRISENIYFFFIDCAKAFDSVDHNKLWKILKEMGIPDHLICLLRNQYAGQEATVRTGHGTTDWFQIGKGVCQGCMFHPAHLTYMQNTLWEILGLKKHKMESSLPGIISITSDMQMTPPLWQKVKRN